MNRLTTHRTWSALAFAALLIVAAPAIVVSQIGRANQPWSDPWSGPWPALLDRSRTVDPQLAALQQRIDRSLERLMTSSREAAQSSWQQADSQTTPGRLPGQITELEP